MNKNIYIYKFSLDEFLKLNLKFNPIKYKILIFLIFYMFDFRFI